jgi:hypothetical protein
MMRLHHVKRTCFKEQDRVQEEEEEEEEEDVVVVGWRGGGCRQRQVAGNCC